MLEVREVEKEFNGFKVLRGVSFDVYDGEAVVLIGRNGAGKSTLLRCIAGLLRYRGSIKLDGVEVIDNPNIVKGWIGYLPQTTPSRGDLTGYQIFEMYMDIYGVDLDPEEWFEKFGLLDAIDTPLNEYSGGMRQRLFLAMAIAHDPRLILMDEPMNNLDSIGKNLLIDIIMESKRMGRSFIVSGHRLSDFITYADKIILIDNGKIIFYGGIDKLFTLLGIARLYIYSPDGLDIEKLPGARVTRIDGSRVIIESSDIYNTLKYLVGTGVKGFFIEEPSIDVIIGRLGGDE